MKQEFSTVSSTPQSIRARHKLSVVLDLRFITLLLFAVIVAMLLIWKPWSSTPTSKDQVISVTGETVIRDKPDEFVFSPRYEFINANREESLRQLTDKSNEIVNALKRLGVTEADIKTDTSNYNANYYRDPGTQELAYSLQLTVTVRDELLVQKVQDYLLTTTPSGSVSPYASFSETKRKSLEAKARSAASKDARKKADAMADNLGFKVGKIKSVSDEQSDQLFDGCSPGGCIITQEAQDSAAPSLSVQPGENEFNYVVTVEYYIR